RDHLGRHPRGWLGHALLAALDAAAPQAIPAPGGGPAAAGPGGGAPRGARARRAGAHPHRSVPGGPGRRGGAADPPAPDSGRGALWNTGLFAWGVARFLGEAGAYARELKTAWPKLSAGDVAGFFGAAQPVAVDVAVLERTKRLAVVTGAFQWDDIGSWDSLLRIRRPDARGNVIVGNVTLGDDVRRSV